MQWVVRHVGKYKRQSTTNSETNHRVFLDRITESEIDMSQYIRFQYLSHRQAMKAQPKIVSEYDQKIPQSQPQTSPWQCEKEPLNHQETPGRQIKQSNQLSLPHQDDCNSRMGIK